jgi:hypothetical protein
MAKVVLKNCFLSINGTDVSANTSKVEVDDSFEVKDMTTFGSGGAKEVAAGLEDGGVNATFKNDFAAAALDATMWALRGTLVPFEVRATQSAVGTSNPKYTGSILINGWKPISASPGDVAEVPVSFPASGVKTRATS